MVKHTDVHKHADDLCPSAVIKTDHHLSWCWARSSQPGREEVRTAVSTRKHSLALPHTHSMLQLLWDHLPVTHTCSSYRSSHYLSFLSVSLSILDFYLCGRLQDSLEFIGQDSNTLWPDQNTGVNSLLKNIGNAKSPSCLRQVWEGIACFSGYKCTCVVCLQFIFSVNCSGSKCFATIFCAFAMSRPLRKDKIRRV